MLSRNRVSPATSLFSGWNPYADAALRVPRRLQHLKFGRTQLHAFAFARVYVDPGLLRRRHAQPLRLLSM